jgi:hypothetical protein
VFTAFEGGVAVPFFHAGKWLWGSFSSGPLRGQPAAILLARKEGRPTLFLTTVGKTETKVDKG